METRTPESGQRARPRHHGQPPASWAQQVEQDRAPPLLLHQPELARQTTRQLSRDRRADLGHHHQNRPYRALPTRHRPISQRHCRIRCRDGHDQHPARRVPRRVELHHLTKSSSPKSRVYLVTGPKLVIPKRAEHHFQPEGTEFIPNVLIMAMHLCGVTRNLGIGCGFNIVPMWHPLRLAEDYAMADILTGGRVIFGVGRGYHTREVETFGSPLIDQNANREMFEEGVEVLFKAFEGKPFSRQGKYYTIPPEVPYRGYT